MAKLVRQPAFHFQIDVDGGRLRHVAITDFAETDTIAVQTWIEGIEGESQHVTRVLECPNGYLVRRKEDHVAVKIEGVTWVF